MAGQPGACIVTAVLQAGLAIVDTTAHGEAEIQTALNAEIRNFPEVGSGGVGWGWGSTLTHNYGGLRRGGGNPATQQLVSN